MSSHTGKKTICLFWVLLFVSLSISCAPLEALRPTATSSATAVPPTHTPSPTLTPRPTATPAPPTATPTPTPLSPSAIFELIAPSIAYVETPLGFGSSILVEGNYLVTNAHVVWPYGEVRAVFPDGSEFEAVPVVSIDHVVDLAVLGPLREPPAPPLVLADGEASVVGSDVYLVGYPREVDSFPQPTITRGLISRMREWSLGGITYFQTDATVAGGQSGGALVSETGAVIGLSGFAFGDFDFALVASTGDLVDRITTLIAGEDVPGARPHIPTSSAVERNPIVRLRHAHDTATFLISPHCRSALELTADSEVDVVLQLVDMGLNEVQEVDEGFTGVERIEASLSAGRPYAVAVHAYDSSTGIVRLQSSCGLIALEDEDDLKTLSVGDTVTAVLDFPGDVDMYYLTMGHGEVANFLVDATVIDPLIWITYPGARSDAWVEDDNSGGGLFGLNAELTFRAPHSGRFIVTVGDPSGTRVGGYSLSISATRSGAPTPVALPATPAPISTEYGDMQLYSSTRYPFTMLVPSTWEDVTKFDASCTGTCFAHDNNYLVIAEENAEALLGEAGRNLTQAQYTDQVVHNLSMFLPAGTLQWRQSTTTETGLPVELAYYHFTEAGVRSHLKLLIAFEDGIGFSAVYIVPDMNFAEAEALIDYSFNSLAVER